MFWSTCEELWICEDLAPLVDILFASSWSLFWCSPATFLSFYIPYTALRKSQDRLLPTHRYWPVSWCFPVKILLHYCTNCSHQALKSNQQIFFFDPCASVSSLICASGLGSKAKRQLPVEQRAWWTKCPKAQRKVCQCRLRNWRNKETASSWAASTWKRQPATAKL